jgi:hypothetical protein
VIEVLACKCQPALQLFIENGLFPTAPSQPRMAVSIDLLNFYHALFERSCDAVNAMAAALNTFYRRRGFHMFNKKVRFHDDFHTFAHSFKGRVCQRCISARAWLCYPMA